MHPFQQVTAENDSISLDLCQAATMKDQQTNIKISEKQGSDVLIVCQVSCGRSHSTAVLRKYFF